MSNSRFDVIYTPVPSTGPAYWLGWRRGAFTCVGWQVTLCDPIWKWRPVVVRWNSTNSYTLLYLFFIIKFYLDWFWGYTYRHTPVATPLLRYHGHIGWNWWKIISRLITDKPNLFTFCRPQHDESSPKGTPRNFSRNRSGVGKIVDFRHLSSRIPETVQDRVQVAIDH